MDNRMVSRTALCLLTLLLASCGGGGDDGGSPSPPAPPPPPPPPSVSVALTFTDATYRSAVRSGFSIATGVASTGISSALTFNARRSFPGAQTVNDTCPGGGTASLALTDNDGNGVVSVGDRVIETYTNCAIASTTTLNSTVHIDVISIALAGSVETFVLRTRLVNYTQTSATGTVTLAGGFDCEWRKAPTFDRFIVSGSEFTVTVSGFTETLRDFSVDYTQDLTAYEYRVALSGELSSQTASGRFTFTTDVPFIGRLSVSPVAGAMTLRGAGNTAIRVEDGGGGESWLERVTIASDFDGDGSFVHNATNTTALRTELWEDIWHAQFFRPVRANVPVPPLSPWVDELLAREIAITNDSPTLLRDIEVDPVRGQLYVSVPGRNEIAIVSTSTYHVLERVAVGASPYGLELADDGVTLYAALFGSGGIAALNLDTRQLTRIETGTANNTSRTWDVVEAVNRLYVTADSEGASGASPFLPSYLAHVDRSLGDVATRAHPSLSFDFFPELARSPDGRFLYVWAGVAGTLYKLDLAVSGAPIVLQRSLGALFPGNMTLSPDGARIVFGNGMVLNSSDLIQTARLRQDAVYAYSADGAQLVGLHNSGVVVYDPQTFIVRRTFRSSCVGSSDSRFVNVPGSDHWVAGDDENICAFSLADRTHPPGQDGSPPP